jgi:superoxide reductase
MEARYMAKFLGIYKCDVCGNIVEVFHEGKPELFCCNEEMKFQDEKTSDTSTEKHVPYVIKVVGGYQIKIGENEDHPMTEKHYIEWIEVIADNKIYRQHLKPGDKPEAFFELDSEKIRVREYCNIHGHWENEIDFTQTPRV